MRLIAGNHLRRFVSGIDEPVVTPTKALVRGSRFEERDCQSAVADREARSTTRRLRFEPHRSRLCGSVVPSSRAPHLGRCSSRDQGVECRPPWMELSKRQSRMRTTQWPLRVNIATRFSSLARSETHSVSLSGPRDVRVVRRGARLCGDVASRDLVAVSQVGASHIRRLSRGIVLLLIPCFLGLLATGAAGAPVRRRRREDGDSDVRARDGSAASVAPLASTGPVCTTSQRPAPLRARYPLTIRLASADSWGRQLRGGRCGSPRVGRFRRVARGRALPRRPLRSGRRRRAFRRNRSGRQSGQARRGASAPPAWWTARCPVSRALASARSGWNAA